MKFLKRNLKHLNNLVYINRQICFVYDELLKIDLNDELQECLTESLKDRENIGKILVGKILKLGGEAPVNIGLDRTYSNLLSKLMRMHKLNQEELLVGSLCDLEQLSVKSYDVFLQEMHIPLSICRMLIAQRDIIQHHINHAKTQPFLVA